MKSRTLTRVRGKGLCGTFISGHQGDDTHFPEDTRVIQKQMALITMNFFTIHIFVGKFEFIHKTYGPQGR